MTLREYIKQAGYTTVDESYYEQIETWRSWYRGKVAAFHNYTIYNKGKSIRRTRASLNMAKQGCEFWADLLWNSECAVNLKGADDALINDILKANDFGRQASVLIERAFAMGTGAFVAYDDNDKTRIDYVTAGYIFPLSYQNDAIESCAFAGAYNEGTKRLMYLMIHEKQADGGYMVYNKFFEQNKSTGDLTPVATPPGVKEQYRAAVKRFAIVKPNIANNTADVPMGLSVFANCIDTLKSIDLAYDGAKTAMEIGRPRVGVTTNMLRIDLDTGELRAIFDPDDVAVYDMGQPGNQDEKVEVKDLTTQYRATEYEASLQTQLTIYSQCLGLGEKAFQWRKDALKTATEVVSNDSAMLRAMEKHQDGLRSAITQLVQAILDINGRLVDQEITIVFDDSVTRDKTREAQDAWLWVVAGKYPFWRYLVDFRGYDEAEAKEIAGEAEAAQAKMEPFAGDE